MGSLPPTRLVSEIEELYEYEVLRSISEPTMFVVRTEAPVIVLGSMQDRGLLVENLPYEVRRRRGGGGMVLLQPDDLWVDWWIPNTDARWRHDVHQSSQLAGRWWQEALANAGFESELHEGGVEGDEEVRVLCFAGKGPGEIFIEDRKVVGVTQWRVREGVFLSTVLHQDASIFLAAALKQPISGIERAIDHHTALGLGLQSGEELIQDLRAISGPWRYRQLLLTS